MSKKSKKVSNKYIWIVGGIVFLFLLLGIFYLQKILNNETEGVGEDSPLIDSLIETKEKENNETGLNGNEIPDEENESETNVSRRKKRFVDEEISSEGILRVVNAVYAYTSSAYKIIHLEDSLEGIDERDRDFYAMFDPTGVTTKAVSIIESREIDSDFRPANSMSTVYLEFSLVSQTGADINISQNEIRLTQNEIRLSLPRAEEGYNFTGKTINIQQYNPENESESYPIYNVREVIENNGGIISLPNLSGVYVSGEPFAYFKIMFS